MLKKKLQKSSILLFLAALGFFILIPLVNSKLDEYPILLNMVNLICCGGLFGCLLVAGFLFVYSFFVRKKNELSSDERTEEMVQKNAPEQLEKNTDVFAMWDKELLYCDNYFLYDDGYGRVSVISKSKAKEIEVAYWKYQAHMDFQKGGTDKDVAYNNRGFVKRTEGNYIYSRTTFADRNAYFKLVDAGGDANIPSCIENHIITSVETAAFMDMPNIQIKTITLPSTLKTIKTNAFEGCNNLKAVYIPSSVDEIQENALPKNVRILVDKNSYAYEYLKNSATDYSYEIKEPDMILTLYENHYPREGFGDIILKRTYNEWHIDWAAVLGYGDGAGGEIILSKDFMKKCSPIDLYKHFKSQFKGYLDLEIPSFYENEALISLIKDIQS